MATPAFELRSTATSDTRMVNKGVSGPGRSKVKAGFSAYVATWNRIVDLERTGLDIRGFIVPNADQEFAESVLREYRLRRAKSTNPLRKKSADRVSSIPVAGSLVPLAVKVWRGSKINRRNVRGSERFRRSPGGFVLNAPILVPKRGISVEANFKAVAAKRQHVGLALSDEGLDLVLQSGANSVRTFHVDPRAFIAPGFLDALSGVLSSASTIGLDITPSTSGGMAHAATQLTRRLRTRQAAGANVFRKVSTVVAETQGQTLKCPHCDAQTLLDSSPQNCVVCHAVIRRGILLASRASAEIVDAWTTYGCSPRRHLGYDRQ